MLRNFIIFAFPILFSLSAYAHEIVLSSIADNRDQGGELWAGDVTTGKMNNLVKLKDYQYLWNYSVSNDHGYVAYGIYQMGYLDGYWPTELHVIKLGDDGRAEFDRTVFSADLQSSAVVKGDPKFFDGKKLLYWRSIGEKQSLWVYELDANKSVQVFEFEDITTSDSIRKGSYMPNFQDYFENSRYYFTITVCDKKGNDCNSKILALDLKSYSIQAITKIPRKTQEGSLAYVAADQMSNSDWISFARCEGPQGFSVYGYNVVSEETIPFWIEAETICALGSNSLRIIGDKAFFDANGSKGTGVYDLKKRKLLGFVDLAHFVNRDASKAIVSVRKMGYDFYLYDLNSLSSLARLQLPGEKYDTMSVDDVSWERNEMILRGRQSTRVSANDIWKIALDGKSAPVKIGTFDSIYAGTFEKCSINPQLHSVVCTAPKKDLGPGVWKFNL